MKVKNVHTTPLAVSTRVIHKIGAEFEIPVEGMPGYETYVGWVKKGWLREISPVEPVKETTAPVAEEAGAPFTEEAPVADEAATTEEATATEEAPATEEVLEDSTAKKRGRKTAAAE